MSYSGWRWCASESEPTNGQIQTTNVLASDQKLPIYAACVVARAPLIKPLPEDWEIEYKTWAKQFRARRLQEIPEAWQKVKKTAHDDDAETDKESVRRWDPASRVTDADKTGDRKSLMRLLDQYLYLVVKHQSGAWSFPYIENQKGETIRQTGERALEGCVNSADVFFIANWPIAHYKTTSEPNRLEFYMKAQILSGNIEIKPESGFVDYVWISKNELDKYFVDPDLEHLLKKALV